MKRGKELKKVLLIILCVLISISITACSYNLNSKVQNTVNKRKAPCQITKLFGEKMKKLKIIISVIFSVIVIGLLSVYFIYGSTLIDITNEKSIINALSSDSNQPIVIIKTAENGNYFGVLYSDPVDEDDCCFHFRSITKAKLYRNKYHNIGISSTSYVVPVDEGEINVDELNEIDENTKTVESFLYTFEGDLLKSNKCSVFEYNSDVIIEEDTDEKQVIEMMQKRADSYKKIDEFDLPNEQIYILPIVYELSQPGNQICLEVGSVSEDEMKSRTMQEAKDIIKDLEEEKQ